jgi:hypothetical protein
MQLRLRVSSFLAGFGLAAGIALLELRKDIVNGNQFLITQVCVCLRVAGRKLSTPVALGAAESEYAV